MRFRSYWDTIKNPPKTSIVTTRNCDICGCTNRGDYKAPKSRQDLKDYYWFCLEHVQEYNRNWDFFKGMSPHEIEEQIRKNAVGDRPSWRSTKTGMDQERLKQKIHKTFTYGESAFKDFNFGSESEDAETEGKKTFGLETLPHPAVEALKIMGLAPPIVWDKVKTRYKLLVKKYHPDTNVYTEEGEEKIKQINLAYSILKISYQNYSELDEK